jgi:hypothetical protein
MKPLASTDWIGLPDQLTDEELERFEDLIWAQNDPAVARDYPDKIVAVYQRNVIAAGDDAESVLRMAERNGVPPEKVTLTTIFGPEMLLAD